MTDPRYCQNCRYHAWTQSMGPHCEYAIVTGRTRLAQMTPAQRKAGYCPVTAAEFAAAPARPMIHMYDDRRVIQREKYDRAMFYKLYGQGLTDGEIAEAAHCGTSTVRRWRKALDLPYHTKEERKP